MNNTRSQRAAAKNQAVPTLPPAAQHQDEIIGTKVLSVHDLPQKSAAQEKADKSKSTDAMS